MPVIPWAAVGKLWPMGLGMHEITTCTEHHRAPDAAAAGGHAVRVGVEQQREVLEAHLMKGAAVGVVIDGDRLPPVVIDDRLRSDAKRPIGALLAEYWVDLFDRPVRSVMTLLDTHDDRRRLAPVALTDRARRTADTGAAGDRFRRLLGAHPAGAGHSEPRVGNAGAEDGGAGSREDPAVEVAGTRVKVMMARGGHGGTTTRGRGRCTIV